MDAEGLALLYFGGAGALGAFADFEFDDVAFEERIAICLGVVNEQVFASLRLLDEAVALFLIKPLNSSF